MISKGKWRGEEGSKMNLRSEGRKGKEQGEREREREEALVNTVTVWYSIYLT